VLSLASFHPAAPAAKMEVSAATVETVDWNRPIDSINVVRFEFVVPRVRLAVTVEEAVREIGEALHIVVAQAVDRHTELVSGE
jgi:hypothetical protein